MTEPKVNREGIPWHRIYACFNFFSRLPTLAMRDSIFEGVLLATGIREIQDDFPCVGSLLLRALGRVTQDTAWSQVLLGLQNWVWMGVMSFSEGSGHRDITSSQGST